MISCSLRSQRDGEIRSLRKAKGGRIFWWMAQLHNFAQLQRFNILFIKLTHANAIQDKHKGKSFIDAHTFEDPPR